MLTHRNLIANVLQFEFVDGRFWSRGGETLVSPLPFFHIYGFTASLNISLYYDCTCVTMPAFDLERFLSLVQERRCTRAQLVPPIILGLAKHPLVDSYDLSSLKTIVSGAAPLAREVDHRRPVRRPRIACVHERAGLTTDLTAGECPERSVEGHAGGDGKGEVGLVRCPRVIAHVRDAVRRLAPPVVAVEAE